MRSPLLLSPRQRIGQARSWLELLFDSLGVASFDQSHTDDQWLASLLQHAARLPSVVAPLPANADTRAVVLISQKATQLAAPFRPAVPSANREVHGQVVAWVGLGFCPALASATQWNGGWTPQGGRAGQDRARLVLEGFLARLQPLTRRFEGTFGQLLLSPVAALDPLLSARAAPLDQYALEIGYGRAVATRAQLIRLALTRTPSAAPAALLQGAIGGPRPTSPEQMLVQGEARLAELARQLAGSGALCAAAYGLLAPPEVSIRGLAPPARRRLQPTHTCHLPVVFALDQPHHRTQAVAAKSSWGPLRVVLRQLLAEAETRVEGDVAQLPHGACLELLAPSAGSAPDPAGDRHRAVMAAGDPAARARVWALVARRALEDSAGLPVLRRLTIAAASDSAVMRHARSADITRLLLQGEAGGLKGGLSRLCPDEQADAQAIVARLAAAALETCKRRLWLRLSLEFGSPATALALFRSPPAPLAEIAPVRWLYHALVSLRLGLAAAVTALCAHLSVPVLQAVLAWLLADSEAAPPAGPPQVEALVALARMCRALERDTAQRARDMEQRARDTTQGGGGRGAAAADDDDVWEPEMGEAAGGGEVSGAPAGGSCSTVRGAASAVAASLVGVMLRHVTNELVERLRSPEAGAGAEARLRAMCAPSVLRHAAQAVLRPGIQSAVRELLRGWLGQLADRWLTREGVGLLLDLLVYADWAAPAPHVTTTAALPPPPPPVRGLSEGDGLAASVPPELRPQLAVLLASAAVGAACDLRVLGDVCALLEHRCAARLASAPSLAAALRAASCLLPSATAADMLRAASLAAAHGGVPGVQAVPPGGMTGKQGRALAGVVLRAVSGLESTLAAQLLAVLLPPPRDPPLRLLSPADAMAIAVGVPGAVPHAPWQTGAPHVSSK